MPKVGDKAAAVNERASEDRPLADGCRYVLVVPSSFGTRIHHKYPTDDRAELRVLFEQHDPQGRGWVHDRDTDQRLRLEDLA